MKSASRKKRAIRLFVAALLESELSVDEMRELLREIAEAPGFADTVANMISYVIDHLPSGTPRKQPPNERENMSIGNLLYSAIQRRRLSKPELLRIMESISSEGETIKEARRNATVHQLISEFISRTSERDAERLLKVIDPVGSDDAYLRGITRRN